MACLGVRYPPNGRWKCSLIKKNSFRRGHSPWRCDIVNQSGQTIIRKEIGDTYYSVESANGMAFLQNGEGPWCIICEVETPKMATQHTDLEPYFNITKGRTLYHYRHVRTRTRMGTGIDSDPASFASFAHQIVGAGNRRARPGGTNNGRRGPEISLQRALT